MESTNEADPYKVSVVERSEGLLEVIIVLENNVNNTINLQKGVK